jgi:hypothetical protein
MYAIGSEVLVMHNGLRRGIVIAFDELFTSVKFDDASEGKFLTVDVRQA